MNCGPSNESTQPVVTENEFHSSVILVLLSPIPGITGSSPDGTPGTHS